MQIPEWYSRAETEVGQHSALPSAEIDEKAFHSEL